MRKKHSTTKLKRRVFSLSEDFLLLSLCIQQLNTLRNYNNYKRKTEFWRDVHYYFNLSVGTKKTIRQLRKRIKTLYNYYCKIKPAFNFNGALLKNGSKSSDFYKLMCETFEKIRYDEYGSFDVAENQDTENKCKKIENIFIIQNAETYYVHEKDSRNYINNVESSTNIQNYWVPLDVDEDITNSLSKFMNDLADNGNYMTAVDVMRLFYLKHHRIK